MSPSARELERAVHQRYARAAGSRSGELCCPVEYDARYLEVLPAEIVERDYGCGDPSRFVRPGETVLDLGSGSGKVCYIAAQIVGAQGRVIGVDMNDEMLALAEAHRQTIGDRLGFHNVAFHKAKIQDLALDYRRLEQHLADQPVRSATDLEALEAWLVEEREQRPLIADAAVDVVVSNCVLNLVPSEHKHRLFDEIQRVLRPGGRAVISDIVGDEEVPRHLQQDPELWSGCIAGAYREDRFLRAFARAGLHGMRIVRRDDEPWQVVEGIQFRAVTVEAFKPDEGPCLDRRQAVIYLGPFSSVTDDDGHTLRRGEPMAVCDKTFRSLTREPYAVSIAAVPPLEEVPHDQAAAFECRPGASRSPRETKGSHYRLTRRSEPPCCASDSQV